MKTKKGSLYLIPNFLGHPDLGLVPPSYLSIIRRLKEFVVENEKPARAFLKACETKVAMDDMILHPIHKHIDPIEYRHYLDACEKGLDMGMLSDAGLPCVADPGYQIVSMAHAREIEVFPMHGLSSVMMALMASGFSGQNFKFRGYLPHDKGDKLQVLKSLVGSANQGETQIFMETPYRNVALLNDIKKYLPPNTLICIAIDLSLPSQKIIRNTLDKLPADLNFLHKRPAVFVIGR